MLKRIKLVQGIGSYTRATAGSIELSNVNVIYGENRFGKSTLGDILHSLETNDPSLIINRKTIPNDVTNPPKVELQFETAIGNHVAKFESGSWQTSTPQCSKLYVFDHSFIHRNVMTGQKPERHNSENVTGFILGEANTALYKQLAGLKLQLRDEKSNLGRLEEQLRTHGITNALEYAATPLPADSIENLQVAATSQQAREQQIAATVQNIDAIKARRTLGAVGQQVNYEPSVQQINTTLALCLQNVHEQALSTLDTHTVQHVNNTPAFKGWAGQGLGFAKGESCPFCGQGLGDDAKSLVAAYQQVFNAQFDEFNRTTKQSLDRLRQPFPLAVTTGFLNQQHQFNVAAIGLYVEPQVAGNTDLSNLITMLNQKHQEILASHATLGASIQPALDYWIPRLEQKYSAPYEASQQIDFSGLLSVVGAYNQAIYSYWQTAAQINTTLDLFKSTLDATQLHTEIAQVKANFDSYQHQIKRITLEPVCQNFRSKHQDVTSLEVAYTQQKESLEQSQSAYLDAYFHLANQLFIEIGSTDFEIIKAANNRGHQVIYELRVKFKGQDIPFDKLNYVFSESDRRALALCVFLAKILSLPDQEKAKAILVLDDPVTSFDNERITLILNKLDEFNRIVKQLIITTHYKGMASKAVRKFRHCTKSVRLMHGANGIEISAVNNDTMMATEHDLAFDRIKAFVGREINENIITELRPFFEEEVRSRFKKQLSDLGESRSDLSVCITGLKNNNFISQELEARLHAMRDSFNTPMHEIGQQAIENTRSIATQMLTLIYEQLSPASH